MSRIGNKPIAIPDGVEIKIDGKKIIVIVGMMELKKVLRVLVSMKQVKVLMVCMI